MSMRPAKKLKKPRIDGVPSSRMDLDFSGWSWLDADTCQIKVMRVVLDKVEIGTILRCRQGHHGVFASYFCIDKKAVLPPDVFASQFPKSKDTFFHTYELMNIMEDVIRRLNRRRRS